MLQREPNVTEIENGLFTPIREYAPLLRCDGAEAGRLLRVLYSFVPSILLVYGQ